MKYLKHINENIQELSSEYLVDLFTLNLEDNGYFDASNISAKYTYSKPTQINPNKSVDYYVIYLTELFFDVNIGTTLANSINMKILSHICKKYDLLLETFSMLEYTKSSHDGTKAKVYFYVSQLY